MSEKTLTAPVQAALKLRFCGDPILRRKSAPVAEIGPEVRALAEKMFSSMFEEDGIGLAAPQVGFNIRLITLATNQPTAELPPEATPGERLLWHQMPVALINPEIVSRSADAATAEEGCLSVPGIYGKVERPRRIFLRTRLLNGESLQIECGGLLARCLQHEVDHLDGILFVDRLAAADKAEVADELRRLEKTTKRALKRGHR